MKTIEARYAGECANCGGAFPAGTAIVPTPKPMLGNPLWEHAVCPDDDPLEPASAPCPDCHLDHQGECF